MTKIGRHHPDDGVAILVHANSFADNVWIATELSFPQCVTDHHAIQKTWDPICLGVNTSQCGFRPQHVKITRTRAEHLDALHPFATGESGGDWKDRTNLLKNVRMLAQIFEFRHGHADIFGTGAIVKNSNQSLRLRKWQRLEKDRLNEREDGDVATNSERQSQYANEKKSRGLYECSRGIAQIGDKIFHSASSTNVADVFMPNRKFHKFIIITVIVPLMHDSARSLSSGPVIAASNSGRCPRSGRL